LFTKPGSLQNRAVAESRSCCPLQATLEMAEAYGKEFEELSALAEKCLRDPGKHLPYRRMLLRLWRYPSFDQWTSWLVYVPVGRYTESDSPIVVQVIWNRRFDYERFSSPMSFASKLEHQCGMRSVPPRGSGWVCDQYGNYPMFSYSINSTHPLPRGSA
jgi:hypothetical protein